MSLRGLFVAAATPLRPTSLDVDHGALVRHCERLLAFGVDGVNLLGTTGEATSLSLEQRLATMEVVARSGLPLDRFMVGTGAAALADAVTITRQAVDLGYAAALLLPPFYYKGVSDEDLAYFFENVVREVDRPGLRIYLYQFPQNTGIVFSPSLIERMRRTSPGVFVGLKDSSGDMGRAAALARGCPGFDVFPSTEAALPDVRNGTFAGIISATLNVTAPLLADSMPERQDEFVRQAVAIRSALSSVPLIPAIRWALADLTGDPAWREALPPLAPLSVAGASNLMAALKTTEYENLRSRFSSEGPRRSR